LKSLHLEQQESMAYLSKDNDKLKNEIHELDDSLERSKDDQAKCRLETNKYFNQCQKLQKELDECSVDLDNLREAITVEQKQKEDALQEKADKENELNNRPTVTVDDIMNHSMFKKL
jgi:chromosome segregation ATPase